MSSRASSAGGHVVDGARPSLPLRHERIDEALRASERRFRAMIEGGSDLIAIIGGDGTITYASPSHEHALGYPPSTLVGVSAFELLHPDDRERVVELFVGGRDDPRGRSEFRFRHCDGSWRSLEGHATNLLDDPAIAGVVVCSRDVTERNEAAAARAEEACITAALARCGRELMALLETPVVLERLCALTTDVLRCEFGTTWLWNADQRAYVPIARYGGTPEGWSTLRQVRFQPSSALLELLAQDDAVCVDADSAADDELHDLLRARAVASVLLMALRRGDQIVGVHVAAYRAPTRPTDAERRIADGLAHLASMALTNARLVEELEAANRLKSEFVSTMSHELRTPLNVILGYAEMLGDDLPAPERALAVQQLRRSTLELLGHVEATLDLSRLEHGVDDETRFTPVALMELWDELRAEFAHLPHDVHVTLRWPPLRAHRLITDRRHLRVVLKNVIGNALKFTRAGEVVVDVEDAGEGYVIVVRDTGIGIAPEHLSTIFELFRQVDGSDSRAFGGVGLGLYVVRALVHRLGGRVDVESTLGLGTTFRIHLPKEPANRGASGCGETARTGLAAVA